MYICMFVCMYVRMYVLYIYIYYYYFVFLCLHSHICKLPNRHIEHENYMYCMYICAHKHIHIHIYIYIYIYIHTHVRHTHACRFTCVHTDTLRPRPELMGCTVRLRYNNGMTACPERQRRRQLKVFVRSNWPPPSIFWHPPQHEELVGIAVLCGRGFVRSPPLQ